MSRATRQRLNTTAELACLLAALSAAGLWTRVPDAAWTDTIWTSLALLCVFAGCWVATARRLGAHSVSPSRNLAWSLLRTMEAWLTTWGVAGLITVTVAATANFHVWIALFVGAALLALLRLAASFSEGADFAARVRTIVVGSCASARALTSTKDAQSAFTLCGFVPFAKEDPRQMPHLRHLGSLDELAQLIRDNQIDAAIVSPSDNAVTGEVHQVMDVCEALDLQTQYYPSFLDVDDMRVGLTWSASRPGLNVQMARQTTLAGVCKRGVDVVGAAVGLVALLPVLIACALVVKLTSSGPILYRQTRVGRMGRTFRCLKFRTMHEGAHDQQTLLLPANQQDGPAFKIDGDPRVTKVGRILRKYSLDELPQLVNVLLGDMSLVGPRPPVPSEVEQYSWWQRRRISIKPGMTCVWQVYGRNRVSFKRWVEMDLFYIDNWSLWMDFKLIAKTVRVVLRGTGM